MRVREFTAEEYIQKLAKNSEDYTKVRAQMYEIKKAEPLIQEVFDEFKKIYPNFKHFKVCFAVGTFRTADLGYFIGYVITKEYYKNAADKSKAVIEIIEMTDPKTCLEKSGYDKN